MLWPCKEVKVFFKKSSELVRLEAIVELLCRRFLRGFAGICGFIGSKCDFTLGKRGVFFGLLEKFDTNSSFVNYIIAARCIHTTRDGVH